MMPTSLDIYDRVSCHYAQVVASERNLPVVPIQPLNAKPCIPGWQQAASIESDVIEGWHVKHPGCGFGIVTNGYIAIKFKVGNGKDIFDVINEFECLHHAELPLTFAMRDDREEFYLIFRNSGGRLQKPHMQPSPTVEVWADGGMIIAPGSMNRFGDRYFICRDDEIAEVPDWLIRLLRELDNHNAC